MATRQPKTSVISVRLPIEQREAIETAAVAAGASVSAFVALTMRQAIDGKEAAPRRPCEAAEPVPHVAGISLSDPSALVELKRIGININQIAHAINSGLPQTASPVVAAFKELFEVLAEPPTFKERLLGVSPVFEPKAVPVVGPAVKALTMLSGAAPACSRPLPIPPPLVQAPLPQPRSTIGTAKAEPPLARIPAPAARQANLDASSIARRRALMATNTIKRPERHPPKSPDADLTRDENREPPHSSARQQLQDGRRVHPARSAGDDERPRGLGLLGKLWPR